MIYHHFIETMFFEIHASTWVHYLPSKLYPHTCCAGDIVKGVNSIPMWN